MGGAAPRAASARRGSSSLEAGSARCVPTGFFEATPAYSSWVRLGCKMQRMEAAEWTRLSGVMRKIQRRFVVECLGDQLGSDSAAGGMDALVTKVAVQCRQNGAELSEGLVRELIFEIAEKLGYVEPLA